MKWNLQNWIVNPDKWIIAVLPTKNDAGEIDLKIGHGRNY